MKEKIIKENVNLYKVDGEYYLNVLYEVEDDVSVREIEIPRISLPIDLNHISFYHEPALYSSRYSDEQYIDVGFGTTRLYSKNGYYTKTKVIREKTQKMTLKEIEKKIGHKIELISEK